MVAGLLPAIAADLGVSVPPPASSSPCLADYALGSPLLAVAAGNRDASGAHGLARAFALGNLLAALATSYRRPAGLPGSALALARDLHARGQRLMPPRCGAERRGRALSIIYVGLTSSVLIGVPFGILVGDRLGWRSPSSEWPARTGPAAGIARAVASIPSRPARPCGSASPWPAGRRCCTPWA